MYTLCFKADLGTARPPEILINCRQLTILWVLFLFFLLHGCGFKGDTQRQPSRQDKMSAVNVFLKITDTFKRVRVIGDRPYRHVNKTSHIMFPVQMCYLPFVSGDGQDCGSVLYIVILKCDTTGYFSEDLDTSPAVFVET